MLCKRYIIMLFFKYFFKKHIMSNQNIIPVLHANMMYKRQQELKVSFRKSVPPTWSDFTKHLRFSKLCFKWHHNTHAKTNNLFMVDENGIEQCFAGHIVECC